MEGLRPSHKTFKLEFVLSARCAGTELAEVAKQGEVQLAIHAIRGNPHLTLPGGPRTRGWVTQRPWLNTTDKTKQASKQVNKRKPTNVNEMISNGILLCFWTGAELQSPGRLHQATDGSRCRDQQPNNRQSLRNPAEEGKKVCRSPRGQGEQEKKKTHRINGAHRDRTDNQGAFIELP